jgi:hypothetical protein
VGSVKGGTRNQALGPSMLERRAMLDSASDIEAGDHSPAPASIVPGQPLMTVCGVPLEAGERVVFFARPHHARQKLVYVLVGVLLAPLVVGFAFIAYGLMYQRYNLRFVAITNRRVVVMRGTKRPRWLRLPEVTDVRARRAGSPAGTIAPSSPERSHEKTDPRHWLYAEAVVIHGRGGALSIDESVPPELIGPAIANAVWTPGWIDRLPSVHHPS